MPTKALVSVVNNKDGSTATATLTGLVSGDTVVWSAYRVVDQDASEVIVDDTPGTGGEFEIDFGVQSTDGYGPSRLFWVKAVITPTGGTPVVTTDKLPVWVGILDQDDVNEIMDKLVLRVAANAAAINIRLQNYYPNLSLKQVVHGRFPQLADYACIEVHENSFAAPYYATPMVRRNTIQAEISGYVPADQPRTMDNVNSAFGRSVQQILNSPYYEMMTLDSGIILTGCQCVNIRFDQTNDGGRLYASWRMDWTGEYSGISP